MKKLFSLALAVMLLCTMTLPASADGSTTLTLAYDSPLNPSYTLSIPASTTISNANGFNDIGMVGITEAADMYGHHIEVSCTISPFTGKETNAEVMSFLSYRKEGATEEQLSGNTDSTNGTPTVLYFWDVNEDGSVANICKDADWDQVESLYVAVFMDGNNAPSDTYTSVVTFTSNLVVNG